MHTGNNMGIMTTFKKPTAERREGRGAVSLLKCWGVPQVRDQGFEGGPGLGRHFLHQILHLMKPAPNP